MADVKITKRMVLDVIRRAAENGAFDFDEVVTSDDVIAFVDTAVGQLDNKAAKAKERAAEKKAEGDELRAVVESVLTDELQTLDVITAAVQAVKGYADVTKSKVTARMTQIVNAGVAHKEQVKTEDGRKLTAYALGAAVEA